MQDDECAGSRGPSQSCPWPPSAPDVTDRVVEYVDHLHEHFLDPVRIRNAACVIPETSGYRADINPEALGDFRCPGGPAWR